MKLRKTFMSVLLGASVGLTVAAAPAAADVQERYFTGVGTGTTAELAVEDAIFNGLIIAREAGFADCTPFGAPVISRRENPQPPDFFEAQQVLACIPSIADEPFPPGEG